MYKKIKTFEQACKVLKLDPAALPVVTGIPEKHQKAIVSHYMLVIIAQALNGEWEPNWGDSNERKYYPWFNMGASGTGFSYDNYGAWHSCTDAGSRLCFKNAEIAEYAGKQFTDLYRDYFVIEK